MLLAYRADKFPSGLETIALNVVIDGEPITLELWNTSGQEEFDHIIQLSYPQTDAFLVCYSVASPASFENIKEKWVPEIKEHCPGTPFLLVGTQTDLRGDADTIEKLGRECKKPIIMEQGDKLAMELKAAKYLECSASTGDGVKNVFEQAVLTALEHEASKKKGNGRCVIA